ncbi:penicillin-binding protein 1C [Rhodoplanes sp. Z2-YC6860]|uniref:penicillin-binding protein 1C n=1 Tax=Rhodoplanes sp. Z2-YC6860 TaxID=674703 RepID=UPI00078D7893|nr:penicillin-binding protein 1C [Rhodoplanes sp. Z2-YC6860]AMN41779.1 penicillin-binding protein 1C [Rhodoplanes sp. Z2-YC6860]
MKLGRIILCVAGAAVIAAALGSVWWVRSLPPASTLAELDVSTQVVDRNGHLLRAYATPDGRWRLPATVEDVDPRFVDMLLAYEDRRFRDHAGVDPLAMARAAWQWVGNGRVISGGSTVTMQVARLLEPRPDRTVLAKLRQLARAIALERQFSKNEILSLYLTLAPYGGNLEGVRAASLAYFGKEPKKLSLSEAALLVALPQSPGSRRPDRAAEAAQRARDRVLDRIAASGKMPPDEVAYAKRDLVPGVRRAMPTLAPHASDQAVAAAPKLKLHRLTINVAFQKSLEDLARERARALGPDLSVAIVAVDNATGEVLARVASSDYFDVRRQGQVDLTDALRSPGSTLKPFIYGLAFEDGIAHPETMIEDRPVRYGAYAPENFDQTFQGTVTARRALQLSLNVPAVSLLDSVGANRLNARLTQAGASLVLPKGEAPGLAMALGGLGIKLSDLTMLYVGLARGGDAVPLVERVTKAEPAAPRRLLDHVAAWYIGNVLSGTPPPENAAGGRIAYKTGTSYGFRDAWSVGFDGKRTIGVWVGRADGAPVPGLIGRAAAAPILFDAFARMGQGTAPLPVAPKGALFTSSSKLPLPLRHFRPNGAVASDNGVTPLRIMYPPNNARVELATFDGKLDPLALKVSGGVEPLTLLVNGLPATARAERRTLLVDPDGPGFVRLTVIDAKGAVDSVMVRLQ